MEISKEKAEELLPLVRGAVAAMERSWDLQGAIEAQLGMKFANLGGIIEKMAIYGAGCVTAEDVKEALESLTVEK